MKKIAFTTALLASITSLSASAAIPCPGCAVPLELVEMARAQSEPTLVFPPGYEIELSGQAVPIEGFDECPSQGAFMTKVFGPSPNDGASNCIVLSKDRSTVPVRIFLPSGAVIEEWEIHRETGETESGRFYKRTSLKRPDGTLVVPASVNDHAS